ncbi:hypothetical protein P0L94_06400 [Microbacter sp. GSS18]|nr:hypothetical protein P0L94_06400 [Microbacter sp. GSS18]
MLVIDKLRRRLPRDEGGVALVTVIVIMFVGFVITSIIAASVLFTIQANASNKDRTQAFIAAESGRDVAVASLRAGIASDASFTCPGLTAASASGASPRYNYSIRTSGDPTQPTSWDGLADACPVNGATQWVVIRSTGQGPDDAPVTIDSVYRWYHGPATTPSGTVAFFEGEFTATKSTYSGDLVIREGDYECNNGETGAINGDLWVLRGGLTITDDCTVTGSVYIRDTIDIKNKLFTVGEDVISVEGSIFFGVNGVNIGGDVHAAGSIDTKNADGVVDGSFITTQPALANHVPADWTRVDGSSVPEVTGAAPPEILPTLEQVYEATNWIELNAGTSWSSVADPVDAVPAGTVCTASELQAVMSAAGTRAVVDMTGCPAGGSGIKVAPGNVTLARDVLILVPPGEKMDLELSGTISLPTGMTVDDGPQLVIAHLDPDGADVRPPSCSSSQLDKFTASGVNNVRTLVYSPCGVNSTMSLTMYGQLYMGSDGLHLNGGTFSCKPMSWPPTLPTISCGVKGEDGIFDPTKNVTRLEDLVFQTE